MKRKPGIRCRSCGKRKSRIHFISPIRVSGNEYVCNDCDAEYRDFGNYCGMCAGQSWRRPLVGLCRCGEEYAPEEVEPAWPDIVSSAGWW